MTEEIKTYMQQLGQGARDASRIMARAETNAKNRALLAIAETLEDRQDEILEANLKDLEAGREKQLNSALLDRLEISTQRVEDMIKGLRQIAELPDPVGEITSLKYRPSGIQVGQMRVPLGVIGIIYESRPNVTIDAAALCLKSGNAVILRGGSEAINSNLAIAECIREGLRAAGLPGRCVQVVDITDREAVGELIAMSEYVDIIIPRGGRGLIERISRESTIPVIKHLDGICHVYIDDAADLDKATKVAYNAKTRRYGICGAMETLLVDETVAEAVLPGLSRKLLEAGVELRGCERSCALVPEMVAATEEDWITEYLAPILAVRMVEGVEDAIRHINTYGSHHTDAIITENLSHARRFLREVDSSSVMLNASTQFADGYEYGLGAEIGISTDKLHARGPVGLEGLTCQKYVVIGDGHTRA